MRTSVKAIASFAVFVFTGSLSFADIYEDLWKTDQAHNGVAVQIEGKENGLAIRVHPQQAFEGKGFKDAAPKPFFQDVPTDKVLTETYQTLEALFDNYELDPKNGEDSLGANAKEDQEIQAFLDAVSKTKVFEQTLDFVNKRRYFGKVLSAAAFKDEIRTIWFEPFDNYFRETGKAGKGTKDCTGFEHVFVGEASGNGIGGYHNWYKFYLDERAGKANYLGYARTVPGAEKLPYVATFAMSWDTEEGMLEKPITGFMVGISPELQLMWGTLAFLQTSRVSDLEDVALITEIDDAVISLVLYREVRPESRSNRPVRGNHIRTFYPKVISLRSYRD